MNQAAVKKTQAEIDKLEDILSRPCTNKVWDETSYQIRILKKNLKKLQKSLDKN